MELPSQPNLRVTSTQPSSQRHHRPQRERLELTESLQSLPPMGCISEMSSVSDSTTPLPPAIERVYADA
jgi:hypothetical protein